MGHLETATVLENRETAPLHFQMILESPQIAREAKPGQFVHVRCGNDFEPLLRRPFSFLRIRPAEGIIELLYKVVGVGTELLSLAKEGDSLDILGPLGKTFRIGSEKQWVVLAGAGVGIPPMVAVAESLRGTAAAVHVVLAGRTKELVICQEDFRALGLTPRIATDDGSLGKKGLITDVLEDVIRENRLDQKPNGIPRQGLPGVDAALILGCGPQPMLKATALLAGKLGIDCQLSVEEKMGCAIGACLACVIPTVHGPSRVCCDGTVYDARDISWDKYVHA